MSAHRDGDEEGYGEKQSKNQIVLKWGETLGNTHALPKYGKFLEGACIKAPSRSKGGWLVVMASPAGLAMKAFFSSGLIECQSLVCRLAGTPELSPLVTGKMA